MKNNNQNIKFDLSQIEIVRPTVADVGALSAFFEDMARDIPRTQRDDVQTRYHKLLTGRGLQNFLEDSSQNNIILSANAPDGVVGSLYARFTSAAEQRQSLWRNPQDKITLMWYGVKIGLCALPYDELDFTLGDALLQNLQDEQLDRFNCPDIDVYVHHNNGTAKSSLIRNEFMNMGRVAKFNHGPKDTAFAKNYDVWRYTLD